MLSSSSHCWIHLLLLCSTGHALRGSSSNKNNNFASSSSSCLPCHVVRPEVLTEDTTSRLGSSTTDHELRCLTHYNLEGGAGESSTSSSIRHSFALEGLPAHLIAANQDAIDAGEWHICLEDYQIHLQDDRSHRVLVLSETTTIHDHSHERHLQNLLAKRSGTQNLLAVRVTSSRNNGGAPDETLDEIEGAIFGTGANPDQLAPAQVVVNQYAAVSHQQLLYQAATGPNINNGVLEIQIDAAFGSTTEVQADIVPLLAAATQAAVGDDAMLTIDKIVYCLPTGANFQGDADWTAFTYLWEPYSYYQKSRCTRLSVVLHEMGHSIGFQHSGIVGGDAYADKTGYMGYALNQVGFPLKAFVSTIW